MPQTKLGTFTVTYQNQAEFHSLKREIFTQGVYELDLPTSSPTIIDAGAHIGLASLFFMSRFPGAEITAIEPHPTSFKLLKENIWQNRLEGQITAINAALGTDTTPTVLHADPSLEWLSTASTSLGGWTGQETTQTLTVPTRTLADFLTKPVDLLKLDIEGAELAVLSAAQDKLTNVKQLVVEFHPSATASVSQLTSLLTQNGFTCQVQPHHQGLQLVVATQL